MPFVFTRLGLMMRRDFLTFIARPCLLCDQKQNHASGICGPCQNDLPWLARACPRCGIPWRHHTGAYNCFHNPPIFNHCQTAFAYDFPIKQLILEFKESGNLAAGRALATCLALRLGLASPQHPLPDLLIPVPSSWQKQRQRGYNPAALIAKDLARALNRPWTSGLIKAHPTQQDRKHQSRQQRLNDVTNPFYLNRTRAPCHIAIIDDVVTSRATSNHVAAKLKAAGYRRISLWALARSLPPNTPNRSNSIDD